MSDQPQCQFCYQSADDVQSLRTRIAELEAQICKLESLKDLPLVDRMDRLLIHQKDLIELVGANVIQRTSIAELQARNAKWAPVVFAASNFMDRVKHQCPNPSACWICDIGKALKAAGE